MFASDVDDSQIRLGVSKSLFSSPGEDWGGGDRVVSIPGRKKCDNSWFYLIQFRWYQGVGSKKGLSRATSDSRCSYRWLEILVDILCLKIHEVERKREMGDSNQMPLYDSFLRWLHIQVRCSHYYFINVIKFIRSPHKVNECFLVLSIHWIPSLIYQWNRNGKATRGKKEHISINCDFF